MTDEIREKVRTYTAHGVTVRAPDPERLVESMARRVKIETGYSRAEVAGWIERHPGPWAALKDTCRKALPEVAETYDAFIEVLCIDLDHAQALSLSPPVDPDPHFHCSAGCEKSAGLLVCADCGAPFVRCTPDVCPNHGDDDVHARARAFVAPVDGGRALEFVPPRRSQRISPIWVLGNWAAMILLCPWMFHVGIEVWRNGGALNIGPIAIACGRFRERLTPTDDAQAQANTDAAEAFLERRDGR